MYMKREIEKKIQKYKLKDVYLEKKTIEKYIERYIR